MVMRVKVKLAPSGIHGLGLFAAEPIAAGSTVWCWDEGVDVCLPLDARDGQDVVPEVRRFLTTYAWLGDGALWLCVDEARFMNHSDTPNCISHGGGTPSIALRNIAVGEELTEDYSKWDEEWDPKHFASSVPKG